MTRVKLNLVSGNVQEREVVTAFKYNDVKYIIFDGESTGSMGLPIILVSKEVLGKVVGITDAEEWNTTKECLKKIISGEVLEYIKVDDELKADDIFYRQLTLPVASFDMLKNSYKVPENAGNEASQVNEPIFEQIAPEDITTSDISSINPVPADSFSQPANNEVINPVVSPSVEEPTVNEVAIDNAPVVNNDYEAIKAEFMKAAEDLFNNLYNKINHND